MKIEQVQMICFSGTGTTRAVAQAVAQGTGLPVKEWDCLPQRANAPFQPDEHTLTILAVPSFGGRAPAPMAQRLEQMKGCGPVVLLSVYGARASEDTLVELYDLAEKTGYQPIAAGEFVARHSIATRIAAHRPSEDDLAQARELGKQALELAQGLAPGPGRCWKFRETGPTRSLAAVRPTRWQAMRAWNAVAVPTSALWEPSRRRIPARPITPSASPACAAWRFAPCRPAACLRRHRRPHWKN